MEIPSIWYCRIQYPTGRLYSLYSIPPTTLCFGFPGIICIVSSSSTSIICKENGIMPSLVYRLTKRIPPSTCFLTTAIRRIWFRLCTPVTSQFLALHHFFHSFSNPVFRFSSDVFAWSWNPLPITFRFLAHNIEFIISEFRSRSLALALIYSRLVRSVISAETFDTLHPAFSLPVFPAS